MADVDSKIELASGGSQRHARTEIGVTTGPIRGSRKVHIATKSGSGIRVAMREIDLAGGEPSVRVYDTSGRPAEMSICASASV